MTAPAIPTGFRQRADSDHRRRGTSLHVAVVAVT